MIGPDNSYNAAISRIVKETINPGKEALQLIAGARSQLRHMSAEQLQWRKYYGNR